MATHCNVLAWRIPGTEEPGGLPSMGLHRVRHDCSDLAVAAIGVYEVLKSGHTSPPTLYFLNILVLVLYLFFFNL